MTRRRHTVTDIVATVYCEQKVVFDRRHGKARPPDIQAEVASDTFEHLRFESEGYTRNPGRLLAKIGKGRPAWKPQPVTGSAGRIRCTGCMTGSMSPSS
jgi:hypothetical protein